MTTRYKEVMTFLFNLVLQLVFRYDKVKSSDDICSHYVCKITFFKWRPLIDHKSEIFSVILLYNSC